MPFFWLILGAVYCVPFVLRTERPSTIDKKRKEEDVRSKSACGKRG